MATLSRTIVESFRSGLRGEVILPADPGYDAARAVWNAMIDRRPAIIVRCEGVGDIRHALAVARAQGLPVSVLEATGRSHVARLVSEGLVELVAERLVLTQRGRLLADAVVRDLVD